MVWAVGTAATRERAFAPNLTTMRFLADEGDISAEVNVGVLLSELGRPEETVGVYDEADARFGQATTPAIRGRLAAARLHKGLTLAGLGRLDRARAMKVELT
ncbi:MAG: hypothetical protein ABSA53_00450 [Streptosporangiaceae bacterium]